MQWDINELQSRFFSKQRNIETNLKELKQYKIPKNDNYRSFYEQQLGTLQVFIILETTDALESPASFLKKLKEMQKEHPLEEDCAYDQSLVVKGWTQTLNELIEEFSQGSTSKVDTC